MKYFLSFLLSLGAVLGWSQEASTEPVVVLEKPQKAIEFDFGIFLTPLADVHALGIGSDLTYQLRPRLVTGFGFMGIHKRIENTYAYPIAEPVLGLFELGWKNQYHLVEREAFRVSIDVTTGMAIARLSDNAEKNTIYNGTTVMQAPVTKVKSFLFLIRPGIELAFRLPGIQKGADYFLTGRASYRVLAGSPAFGNVADLNSYSAGIGLKIVAHLRR